MLRVLVRGGPEAEAGRHGEGAQVVRPRPARGARRDHARLVDLVHHRWRHVGEALEHHVGAGAEGGLVGGVDWSLQSESCVELGNVVFA